jgi:acetyl-CoA synthetase
LAQPDPHRLGRSPALCRQTYFSDLSRLLLHRRRRPRDEDGYYWITGRVDDVLNVSGHRLGTAEIESALVLHPKRWPKRPWSAIPHDIKGQGIYAYVTLMNEVPPSDALRKDLIGLVSKEIGRHRQAGQIQWAPGLPKTRSGKIMRRILRKVAANELDNLGDTRRWPSRPSSMT